jgi:hypothetical protein
MESAVLVITSALRIAAVEYGKDAAAMLGPDGSPRLVDQFNLQAEQAALLADDIDERGLIQGIDRWLKRYSR